MKDLFVAAYCYGKLGLDSMGLAETAKKQGFNGIEFLSPIGEAEEAALKATGLKVIDCMSMIDLDSADAVDRLHRLGVKYLQVGPRFGCHEQALKAAELMDKKGAEAAKRGFKVFYHNHTLEWLEDGGETLMETIVKNTDAKNVCVQMDAGWAVCAGIDPEAFIKKYPGRVEMMHVKASTGKLGPFGVGFMAPGKDEPVTLEVSAGGPPPADGDAPAGPPKMSPEMAEAMANIKKVSGAMADCVWDYSSLMRAAEENGCKAFIIERDEFYLPDVLRVIQQDADCIRKFW